MVRKVTAWEAEDGSVHGTEWAAAVHDTRKALGALGIFNEGTINGVIQHWAQVHLALEVLVRADDNIEKVLPDPYAHTDGSRECRPISVTTSSNTDA